MTNQSLRIITITLPSSLVPSGGTNVMPLTVVADAEVAGSKRAIERQFQDSNTSSPSRRKRVQWTLGGLPAGNSLQSAAGGLATDLTQGIDVRWPERLIPTGKQNLATLTGDDPTADGTSLFGEFLFGDVDNPFGGGVAAGQVDVFAEQGGYILVGRGRLLTVVDPANSFALVSTTVMDAEILDMDHWFGNVYIALGSASPMQRVVSVTATGPVLEDVVATSPSQTVYAFAIKRGSDRAWYIDAASGATYNFAGFTLDAFESLAPPFQVGDPRADANGIGPFNAYTMFGYKDNFYSFTDQGKPIPLSRAIYSHHSDLNGKQWADPGWGYNFATSQIGLRAIANGLDNPVGVGEAMRNFTGHNGIPKSIYSERGELQVAYLTTGADSYAYRGVFAGSDQPALFPWAYVDNTEIGAWFSSVTGAPSQGVWLIRANGTNLVYTAIADDGRDDLYPSYTYDQTAGVWYGTTLDADRTLLKTARLCRVYARSLTSGSSWAIALGFDTSPVNPTGSSYTAIGTVTANGANTILPISAGAPISSISGYTIKPRVTGTFAGSGAGTTPPELYGVFELEYDERPEQFEVIDAIVRIPSGGLSDNQQWTNLQALVSDGAPVPIKFSLPDDLPPGVTEGGQSYGHIVAIENRHDVKDATVEGVHCVIYRWPEASQVAQ